MPLGIRLMIIMALVQPAAKPLLADDLVFVLAGQSNMAGSGVTKELPDELKALPKNVTYFYRGAKTEFTKHKNFGPEVAFAHACLNFACEKPYPEKDQNVQCISHFNSLPGISSTRSIAPC